MVPLVRFELTYYTPLFERGDFAKFVHGGIIKQDVVSKPGLEPTTRPQRAGLLSAFRQW